MERKLLREYHIEFVGPVESLSDNDKPKIHKTVISHIQKLGQFQFEQYQETIAADIETYPWREQVRQRAKRIVQLAKRCRDARKNEAGWRFALEPEIMARFGVEVSCRRCQGRLWRSEQEVIPDASDDEAPDPRGLRSRQEKRQPCMCNATDRMDDPLERGIDPLFDDRAEEAIIFDEELRSKFSKRKKHLPDRVWGLRKTNRMQNILNMVNKHSSARNQTIEESLRLSPFRVEDEPLLFPFLVLEAKSEKSADSFMNIEIQTAFAIRELLMIQDNLRQTAGSIEDQSSIPLVWFLSNRGEQWRVYICYIEHSRGSSRFVITRLWDGAIDSVNCALQLVLIMDYICDWARDKFRQSIIRHLRELAVDDRRSLTYDSDILSLADRLDLTTRRVDSLGRSSIEANVILTEGDTVDNESSTTRDILHFGVQPSGQRDHTRTKLESIEESVELMHTTHVESSTRPRSPSPNRRSESGRHDSKVPERQSERDKPESTSEIELEIAVVKEELHQIERRIDDNMSNGRGRKIGLYVVWRKKREALEDLRAKYHLVST